jgi:hypothetical protein
MQRKILLALFLVTAAASCRKHLPVDGERCTAGDPNCICDPQSGECTIQGVDNPGGAGCQALTCTGLAAQCGEYADTCTKKTVRCGECDSGQVCQYQKDASGKPTGSTCIAGTATSCASAGLNCGTFTDPVTNQVHDCTQEVNGGQPCPTGTTCGGSGLANVCGCTPLTCSDVGRVCGTTDGNGQPLQDGCGGTLNCDVEAGGCGAGKVCNPASGTCSDANCTPKSCADLGNPCGQVSDGCGGLIACAAGQCATDQLCDATSHKCLWLDRGPDGTTTVTDPSLSQACVGRACGAARDACNIDHTCKPTSVCGAQFCIGNQCSNAPAVQTTCPIGRCGPNVTDQYGRTIAACSSATCPPGQVCQTQAGTCVDPGATTCLAQGKNCGDIYYYNSGNQTLDCGDTCPKEPGFPQFQEVCGGSGTPGVCALQPAPATCIENNVHCGYAYDSCGNQFTCGNCAVDNKCQNEPTQNQTICEACQHAAGGPGANGNDGDYLTCNSAPYHVIGPPEQFYCGTGLDNHCAGTINCACPNDNSAGLYGAPYKKSTGVVACSTSTPGALGQCACTPDPNVCKNANACETTLADDGCGHPVNCGVCAAGSGTPPVCAQNTKTCCAPNSNACATSCSATATTECNGQVTVSCTGCTTSASGDTETVCGGECTGNTQGAAACKPDKTCCLNNTKYSTTDANCCPVSGDVLSTCSPASSTCQTATSGSCCLPWTCAQYLTANPGAANHAYNSGTLQNGCGGTIAAACNFCGASTGNGANNDGWVPNGSGAVCVCAPPTATDCTTKGDCTGQVITNTCTNPSATSASFTCTLAAVCGANTVCNAGVCCGTACGSNCNDTICGGLVTCPATDCSSGNANQCNTTTDTCCPAGQQFVGGSCCPANRVNGSTCCASGTVAFGGACCTPKTCGQLGGDCGSAVSDTCGGTVSCSCSNGETCSSGTSGTCSCPTQHVCAQDDCGTFGPACNSKDCGTCSGNSDGKTVCSGNTCTCPGVSCGTACDGSTRGSGACQITCNSCASPLTCQGGTCACPPETVSDCGTQCGGQKCNSCGSCITCPATQCTGSQVCTSNQCCTPDLSGFFNFCQDHQGGQFIDNCGGIHDCSGGTSGGG